MTTETNAERLQRIKRNHEGLVAYTADIGSNVINLPRINSDMAFLIERVQELETRNQEIVDLNDITPCENEMLKQENARLREALKSVQNQLFTVRGRNTDHDNEITGLCIEIKQALAGEP